MASPLPLALKRAPVTGELRTEYFPGNAIKGPSPHMVPSRFGTACCAAAHEDGRLVELFEKHAQLKHTWFISGEVDMDNLAGVDELDRSVEAVTRYLC